MIKFNEILRKSVATALFPFALSANLTAVLDGISATSSFAKFGGRLAGHFGIAVEREIEPKLVEVIATAYSSTIDQTDSDPFITAANTTVRDGIVAANFLNFHSKIKIPGLYGDKVFAVEDRMNRRYTDAVPPRIDVWMPSRYLAKQFGVRKVAIIILD